MDLACFLLFNEGDRFFRFVVHNPVLRGQANEAG